MMYYSSSYQSPFGTITLISDSINLVNLLIENQKYSENILSSEFSQKDDLPVFIKTKKWLDDYFEGSNPTVYNLPLNPMGTKFRQEVWDLICKIPYGQVTTYGEIARKIALKKGIKTMSSQAVGGAIGHNPISIIIPCHRVVGANGNLTGYGGGIEMKIKLLEHEGLDMSGFYTPKKGTAL